VSDSLLLLDVNIPIYAAGQPHPYKAACVRVMTKIAEGELHAAIDAETIQEILYRYGALKRWDIAVAMATNLAKLVPTVYPILSADAELAIGLFAEYAPQGIKARDLIHAAVMQHNGLSQIISTDQHFDQIDGIIRLDPQQLYQSATA
jgi:predicted nucleic acid-binding protein